MTGSVENVYTEALMEIAEEEGSEAAAEINGELAALSRIFSENTELYAVLDSPIITDEEKKDLLRELFEGKISRTSYGLLYVLTENGRCRYLEAVAAKFKEEYYSLHGIAEVTVTTVKPLSDGQKQRLTEKLKKLYGREIILTEKIDASLVGGVAVSYGDSMLDGSVRTKLDGMKKQIKNMIS